MLLEQLKIIYSLFFVVFIWFTVLSFFLIKTVFHYRKLTKGAKDINLQKVLEQIIEKQTKNEQYIAQISQSLNLIDKQAFGHFQKSSLVRFNPFEDSGGDQSFSIALLDANNNGFVISSLHSRSGTRVYAKNVVNGTSSTHAFTKEEKEAVEKASKIGKIVKDNKN